MFNEEVINQYQTYFELTPDNILINGPCPEPGKCIIITGGCTVCPISERRDPYHCGLSTASSGTEARRKAIEFIRNYNTKGSTRGVKEL